MKKLQIGIIGSCSDLNYSSQAINFATKLGELISKAGHVLIFGAEKDINSLPTISAIASKKEGGETIGITYEKGLEILFKESASVVIATGLIRGGGRELTLILSCDVVIAISGGSGTLNEISIAYQANIPVITVKGFGGWSDNLSETYLDDRKRYKFISASTPEEAISLAIKSVKK